MNKQAQEIYDSLRLELSDFLLNELKKEKESLLFDELDFDEIPLWYFEEILEYKKFLKICETSSVYVPYHLIR